MPVSILTWQKQKHFVYYSNLWSPNFSCHEDDIQIQCAKTRHCRHSGIYKQIANTYFFSLLYTTNSFIKQFCEYLEVKNVRKWGKYGVSAHIQWLGVRSRRRRNNRLWKYWKRKFSAKRRGWERKLSHWKCWETKPSIWKKECLKGKWWFPVH